MTQQDVMSRVIDIVRPFAKSKEALADVTPETSILKDLKVNSARLVDIILAFEDEFDIGVDDDDADKVNTIDDAVQMVMAKKAAC